LVGHRYDLAHKYLLSQFMVNVEGGYHKQGPGLKRKGRYSC
jgi:hypothetical protein